MPALCVAPEDMVPILDIPEALFHQVLISAAGVTLTFGEPLAVLGAVQTTAVCCTNRCQLDHPDSVLLIPDVVLIELISNGFAEESTLILRRNDGRSVSTYRIDKRP